MGLENTERQKKKKKILQKKQSCFENNPLSELRHISEICTETFFRHQFSKSWNKLTPTPQTLQCSERTRTHTKRAHMTYRKHYPSLRSWSNSWRLGTEDQFYYLSPFWSCSSMVTCQHSCLSEAMHYCTRWGSIFCSTSCCSSDTVPRRLALVNTHPGALQDFSSCADPCCNPWRLSSQQEEDQKYISTWLFSLLSHGYQHDAMYSVSLASGLARV